MGAAIAAGLHVKFWESTDVIKELIKVDRKFKPAMGSEARDKKLKRWG
jgi:glycerol kinase